MASSRYDRIQHRCLMCGVVIDVQKSRARHVLGAAQRPMHPRHEEEREVFRTKGRWPKAVKP